MRKLGRELRRRTKIEIGPLNQAYGDSRKTINRCFQRPGNRSRVRNVLSEIPAFVDAGDDEGR